MLTMESEQLDAHELLEVRAQLENLFVRSQAALSGLYNLEDRAYMLALRSVAMIARNYLDDYSSLPQLAIARRPHGGQRARSILSALPAAAITAEHDVQVQLSKHRRTVVAKLLGEPGDYGEGLVSSMQGAAQALLRMLFRRIYREKLARTLIRAMYGDPSSHFRIMREVLSSVNQSKIPAVHRFGAAFCKVANLKQQSSGAPAKLILIHDIDSNLTASDEHYRQFPNGDFYIRVQQLHRELDISPSEARFAILSIFGANHSAAKCHWYSQLRLAGRQVHDSMFKDALSLFAQTIDPHCRGLVESCFITGNNSIVAAQIAQDLGVPDALIWGIDEQSIDGFDKHFAVLEIIDQNPGAIFVLSDDGDSQLLNCLTRGSVLPEFPFISLQDLVFFVARKANLNESNIFPISMELSKGEIPFLTNVCSEVEHQGKVGYQGMIEVFKMYQSFVAQNTNPIGQHAGHKQRILP